MNEKKHPICPDCDDHVSRRDFVKAVGGAAALAGTAPLWLAPARATAAPTAKSAAETAVKQLYESLNEKQRNVVCKPFDDPLRKKISANWEITEAVIGDFFDKDQQKVIDDVLRGVTTEDGYERLIRQMAEDTNGGFGKYTVAIFGEPGTSQFEFEMTGRHLTIRADGNSVPGAAFGGPMVYGHGQSDPKKNLFHYQVKRANEVFAALDGKQREQALRPRAPKESEVPIQGKQGKFPGIAVGELSDDQKELVESVIKTILAPYRKEDVDEVISVLKAGGGLDSLHAAFYRTGDLENDEIWDIWRLEGPTFVWHFRGAPHVHTYVNIGMKV